MALRCSVVQGACGGGRRGGRRDSPLSDGNGGSAAGGRTDPEAPLGLESVPGLNVKSLCAGGDLW